MTTWLEDMRTAWNGNPVVTVISLRGRPHRTDAAATGQARAWAAEAQAQKQGWLAELFAQVFANILGQLAAHRGDPPAGREDRELARAVLNGSAPADFIRRTDARVRALAPDLDQYLAAAESDAARLSARMALANITVLLALPHVDVLRLRQELPPRQPGEADPFGDALQAAFDCPANDPDRREALLRTALELALADLDHPSSAVPVLEALAYGGIRPSPETLRLCLSAMTALTRTKPSADESTIVRVRNDNQAQLFGVLAIKASSAGLGEEPLASAAAALEAILRQPLSPRIKLSTALAAARSWTRAGRLDRADLLLGTITQIADEPSAHLRAAELEAEIRARSGDRAGATALLLDALYLPGGPTPAQASNPQYAADRRRAILTLIDSWPVALDPASLAPAPALHGLDPWIDEAERLIDTAPPRPAAALRGQLMTALFALGLYRRGAEVRKRIDFAAWAGSEGFAARLADVEQWSAREAAKADASQNSVPGDAGKDYEHFYREVRYREAAADAESRALTALDHGFCADAYDYLAAAGQMHAAALDLPAALGAFDRAFALLERDLLYIPYPELVIRRLAAWPDRYQLAALTALAANDPVRALAFAETGRARAIGSRLGMLGTPRPDQAPPEDWARFGTLWRRGIAEAAAELAAPDANPTAVQAITPTTSILTKLRREFAADGIAPTAFTPVAPPVDAEAISARLAAADRPTAVLYSLVYQQHLRFIRITAGGVTEIRHDRQALSGVLSAVRGFAARIRISKYVLDDVYDLLPDLLDEVAPALEPVLSKAVEGCEGGRLVWVPQGELAALPLHAIPFAGRHLCDTVAVMVAGSLTSALVHTAVPQRLHTVAIRGVASLGQPPTEGAATLLPAGSREYLPESPDALDTALLGATLVHLACHGVFDWSQLLETTLRLGFDLKVADLFDAVRIDPDAAVVLGTCDSGTIAQTDLNEGVGIPTGLLAAGARTVIGAAWPVSHVAAVGLCRKLIKLLLAGRGSPEALREAACWLRDATGDELLAELAAADHPLAAKIAADWKPEFRASRPFTNPARWAAYVHWGAPWQAPEA